MRHFYCQNTSLASVFLSVAGAIHHPAPGGFDPSHAVVTKVGGGGEFLGCDGGNSN